MAEPLLGITPQGVCGGNAGYGGYRFRTQVLKASDDGAALVSEVTLFQSGTVLTKDC